MSEKRKDSKGRVLKTGESQRKDGRYQYRYTDLCGERRIVYAKQLDELRKIETEITATLRSGVAYQNATMSVGQLINQYIDLHQLVRVTTMNGFKSMRNKVMRYEIAQLPISKCTKTHAKLFCRGLYDEGLGERTIYGYHGFMRRVFQMAVDDGVLKTNPFAFQMNEVIPNDGGRQRAVPTEAQLQKWMDFVQRDTTSRKWYDIYILLLGTGLRVSELCGLTLKDINWEQMTISVNKQLTTSNNAQKYIVPPKSKAGYREIPITETTRHALESIISKRRKFQTEYILDGYSNFLVLCSTGKPMHALLIDSACRRSVKKFNNLVSPDDPICLTPHTLRHIYCTRLIRAGVNIKVVQYLMGHSSSDMTLKVYTHVSQEWMKDEFAKCAPVIA